MAVSVVDHFRDRREAGRILAENLLMHAGHDDVVVLGLPRGGVPVAFEVAQALQLPLDVFIVRKLGVPGFEELAMGAIASGGVRVLNPRVLAQIDDAEEALATVTEEEMTELARRELEYRAGRPLLALLGKTVIVVDDGLATGASMRAAVAALRSSGVARIVVAVPVASPSTCEKLRGEVDDVVCLLTPPDFQAVGFYYESFPQTTDDEVRELLARAAEELP